MNDENNKSQSVSDEQMDQLLQAFYQSEVPAKLQQLPSSWPQLQQASQDAPEASEPSLVTVAPAADSQSSSTASRGIAVAIATLAMCMMVMVFSSPNSDTDNASTDPASNTMNVSENGGSDTDNNSDTDATLGNGNTTLEEIDNIDFDPKPDADNE